MANDLLEKLESQILQKRTELADLETAARVIRQLAGIAGTTHHASNGIAGDTSPRARQGTTEFADKTILEASVQILREAKGRPMHYREIAAEAVGRGYSSGRDKSYKSLERSFWDTLRRRAGDEVVFEGKGKFVLDEEKAGKG